MSKSPWYKVIYKTLDEIFLFHNVNTGLQSPNSNKHPVYMLQSTLSAFP